MLEYLRANNIALTAYAPLAQGRAASDPVLQSIGRKHNVSSSQVAIAWLLGQEGVIAIPKAAKIESQTSNLSATAVNLDEEDLALIAALPKDQRYVNPPFACDWNASV